MSPRRARAAANARVRLSRPRSCSSADRIKRSGGPGELGRREARPALVLDAEGADPRAFCLGDRQIRTGRMEHALEAHGLTGLDTERNDVFDFEVDCVSNPHAVANAVVLDVDRRAL